MFRCDCLQAAHAVLFPRRSTYAGTLVAPPLAQMGLVSLCVSRAIVGLGEGFAPSAVTHVMASIVPQSERSRAVSYVFGGLDLGSVIGLLLCGPLIAMYGWPSVFYVFAILGLGWAVIWPLSKPGVVDDVVAKEKQLDDVLGEIRRRNDAQKSGAAFVERTTEELDDVRKVRLPSCHLLDSQRLPEPSLDVVQIPRHRSTGGTVSMLRIHAWAERRRRCIDVGHASTCLLLGVLRHRQPQHQRAPSMHQCAALLGPFLP